MQGEQGQGSVEYGLILALVVLVGLVGVSIFGDGLGIFLDSVFGTVASNF